MITFVLLKDSSVVLKNGLERGKSEGRGQPGKYCQSPEQIIGSEHVAVERSGCYPDIFNKYSKSCGDDWVRGWGSILWTLKGKQKNIRNKPHAHKFDNLDGMDQFLKRHNVTKLT